MSLFCAGGLGLSLSWTRNKQKAERQHSKGAVRGAGGHEVNICVIFLLRNLQWLPIACGITPMFFSLAFESLSSAPLLTIVQFTHLSQVHQKPLFAIPSFPTLGEVPSPDHGFAIPAL